MENPVKDFYLFKGFNCAQTMVILSSKRYNFEVSNDLINAMAGLGGGLQTESLCGVVSGGVMALSLIFPDKDIQNQAIVSFQDKLKTKLPSFSCKEIKKSHRDENDKCLNVVETAFDSLTEVVNKITKKTD